MDVQEAIEKRWGCRKYTEGPIEKEKLGIVLDAGRLAPSAGNLQDRSFIVVKEDKKREEIAQACGNQLWMQTAPVFIVVISENKTLGKYFGPKREKVYSIQDTSFSVENMLLAATNIGLGCSLVVGFNEEKIREILNIPNIAVPYAVITLGIPAEEAKISKKYGLERFVYFDKYGERIEEPAAAFGEWSTARQKLTAETVKGVKRETKNAFGWIKELFSKKKEEKEEAVEKEIPAVNEKAKEETKEYEIPRQLPRK